MPCVRFCCRDCVDFEGAQDKTIRVMMNGDKNKDHDIDIDDHGDNDINEEMLIITMMIKTTISRTNIL